MDRVEWAQTKIQEIALNITNTFFFFFNCKGDDTLGQVVHRLCEVSTVGDFQKSIV